jgi:hypothetical protein
MLKLLKRLSRAEAAFCRYFQIKKHHLTSGLRSTVSKNFIYDFIKAAVFRTANLLKKLLVQYSYIVVATILQTFPYCKNVAVIVTHFLY